MNRRDFIKKSAVGTCAFVIGQGLVLSSCKKENPVNLTDNGEISTDGEPITNGKTPTNGETPVDNNLPRITEQCICCGDCAAVCDAICGAIKMGENHYYIDSNVCISCGRCVDACPLIPSAIIIP